MAQNSTQSGMELLELPDEDLLNVFSYLDHKSQLNSMLVCRRFEQLIGQTHQFYKNRELFVHYYKRLGKRPREDSDRMQTRSSKRRALDPDIFMPFGRKFGEVTLWCFFFRPDNKNFTPLIENLQVFGSKIITLNVQFSAGFENRLLEVLRLANNVQELSLCDLRIYSQPKGRKNQEPLNFPHLKSLDLVEIDNFEMIQDAFAQVNTLRYLQVQDICRWRDSDKSWESYQPIVFRQTNLRTLELSFLRIKNFEWKEINSLKKLSLDRVLFSNKEAFESFTKFVKTLKNISELELDITEDQSENPSNNYSEILMHLLKLKTLLDLTLFCEDIGNLITGLQIRNPSVTTLATNQLSAVHCFPNLQKLHVERSYGKNENFTGMICLNALTEIEIDDISFEKLTMIKCPRLKKFSAENIRDYEENSLVFETFAQNNPEIEELELFKDSAEDEDFEWYYIPDIDAKDVAHLIKNLPKLRIFKMSSVYCLDSMEVAKVIVENFGKLEDLELKFLESEGYEAYNYIKKNLPHCKTSIKNDDIFSIIISVKKI